MKIRISHTLICAWVLFVLSVSAAEAPAWFLSFADDPALLTGRGVAEVEQGGDAVALEAAKRDAMRNLSESLVCRLSTEVIDQYEETGDDLNSCFASRTVVETVLELVNVRTIEHAVVDDMAFVLVGADRETMMNAYRDRTEQAFHMAADEFVLGCSLEKEGDAAGARAAYEAALAALSDARQSLQIYLALSGWGDPPPMPKALPERTTICQRLKELSATTPQTLKEIADAVGIMLTRNVESNETNQAWVVLPVQFEHGNLVSPFGYQLKNVLSASLAAHSAIRVTDNPSRADVIVRGRTLQEGESVLLVFEAGDHSAKYYLTPVTCKSIGQSKLEPPNLKQVQQDELALRKAMQVPTGLGVELKTDRGDHGPVTYRFGDQPKLAIRADRACVVRLIYVTSDGKRLLLLDRYPVGEHQVNRWVRLPLELEVCEPAGVEQMLLQAVTKADDARLPPLQVKQVDMGGGYMMPIIQEPLDQAVARTRGVMLKKPAYYAEIASLWTIFEE